MGSEGTSRSGAGEGDTLRVVLTMTPVQADALGHIDRPKQSV
jgi:hypothetical protein